MRLNVNFDSEMLAADALVVDLCSQGDYRVKNLIDECAKRDELIYSDIWSLIYDFMHDNYGDKYMNYISGLTCLVELAKETSSVN